MTRRGWWAVAVVSLTACAPAEDKAEVGTIVPADPANEPDPVPPASNAWQDAVFARIAQGEYAIRKGDTGLSAFNRDQGLRVAFGTDGVRVRERERTSTAAVKTGAAVTTDGGIRIDTVSLGRLNKRVDLEPAAFVAGACRKDGAMDEMGECLRRAEARRGSLVEWWENTPAGLEQGFDVLRRPEGEGALQIVVKLDASSSRIDDGAQSATIVMHGGKTLSYGKLFAEDATKRALPIRLVAAANGLAIEVDDAGAVYPVRVDPLLSASIFLQGTAQTGASFGTCVAAAGDVNGDGFGDVVVGAPSHDGAFVNGGKAYLFRGEAAGLATSPSWSAEGTSANAAFGCPATGAGDVNGDGYGDVLVAAPLHDNGQTDEGAVYLYRGFTGGVLEPTAAVVLERNVASGQFGRQLVAAGDVNKDGFGDVAIASATNEMTIYRGSAASGLETSPTFTRAMPGGTSGPFLTAGDINGDGYGDVMILSSTWSVGSASSLLEIIRGGASGPAFWFGSSMGPVGTLSAAMVGDVTGDGRADLAMNVVTAGASTFNTWVTCFTDTGLNICNVAAGGPLDVTFWPQVLPAGDVNGDGYPDFISSSHTQTGVDLITVYAGPHLNRIADFTSPSETAANPVSAAGDVNGDGFSDVLVGLPGYDGFPHTDRGRAQLFLGSGETMATAGSSPFARVDPPASSAGAHFGTSLAGLGDVNGDGYGDIAVAAPDYQGKGAAWVYRGTSSGISTSAVWSRTAPGAGDDCNVAAAGDVDGDGYADLLVSHPRSASNNVGWAGVFRGDPTVFVQTSTFWALSGTQADSRFGEGIAGVGDVNADGLADFAVAAPRYNTGALVQNGRVHVYLGHPTTIGAAIVREGTCNGGRLGFSLAGVHDYNGDTIDDFAAGAPWCGGGRIQVYAGSQSPASLLSALPSIDEPQADARFGVSVAGPGDVNGDRYADILAGAHLYDNGAAASAGRASIHYGGPAATPWVVSTTEAGALVGRSVGAAGDVNGDGLADVIVGSPAGGADDRGRALVFLGAVGGPSTTASWSAIDADDSSPNFGIAVSGAGDVNGDGYSDVLVGSPNRDLPMMADAGGAFVYFGSNRTYATDTPRFRMRRFGTTTPIAPRGKTGPALDFDVTFVARNAAGRSPVRARVQASAHGLPWGPWELYPYTADSLTGVTLTATVHTAGKGGIPHFRARAEYLPSATAPWLLHSPWRYGGTLGDRYGVAIRTLP